MVTNPICPHSPGPLIAHQRHGKDGIKFRLGTTPKWIGKEPHRIANGFKQRPASRDAIPFPALTLKADDGNPARHQKKVAEPGLLCVMEF